MRNKLIIGAAAIGIMIAVAAFFISQRAPKGATATGPVPVLTVTVATPKRVIWPTVLEVSGAVAAWQEAVISAQINGYQIAEILANVGDQVKKGQVMARIDSALLRADEAVLLANFEQADANYKRSLTLKSKGFMSDQSLLQLETQMKTTRALLNAKRLQIRYTDVIAPDDGAVSARTATLGSVVSTGQEMFRLVRQNRLEWRGELSANQLTRVRVGQAVRLSLPNGSDAIGTVRQTSPTLSQESRLAFVYADLELNSDARAGMYATGGIVLGEQPALAVPAESVVLRDGRSYVLELAGEPHDKSGTSKVLQRAVDVGRRVGTDVEILNGLSDSARIVVRGSGFLKDGDIVRIAYASPRANTGEPEAGRDPGKPGPAF